MLSRPTYLVWIISTVIVALVLAIKYFGVASMIPVAGPLVAKHMFEALLIGYLLLWAGTVFKGI